MSNYGFNCPDCGERNDVDPAVVEACNEAWLCCDHCGKRQALNLAGKP